MEKANLLWKCVHEIQQAQPDSKEYTLAVEELRRLALSEFGLCDDALRKKCWPILLNVEFADEQERKMNKEPPLTGSLRHSDDWKSKSHTVLLTRLITNIVCLFCLEYIKDHDQRR